MTFLKYCIDGILIALAIVCAILFSSHGQADESVSFEKILESATHNSPDLQAAHEDFQAAQIGQERASRHWYPRLYANARAFSTNDPGTSFMYTLEQRQITSADFNPSSLNQPGSSFFKQGALGLDLPLYEGGMRVAGEHSAERAATAKTWQEKAEILKEYATLAANYAVILILDEEKKQLLSLRDSVSAVVDHYSIGSKSNPVGYSGLLGLKNLKNRVEGLLVENEAQSDSKKIEIKSYATDLPDHWSPQFTDSKGSKQFLSNHLTVKGAADTRQTHLDVPPLVLAARSGAEALDYSKEGEKARFLPRVGVFAEGDLYAGGRATGTSYNSGAYLQWDLFSAPNFGAIDQAAHSAQAASLRAESMQLQMKSEHEASESAVRATERNLVLLDESSEILEEQTQTARLLFKNGSINALQLVEVLNRRADLLVNRLEAQINLIQSKQRLFLTSPFSGVLYDHAQ